MVFWGIPKVRIFIPLTLSWVLLGGLTGCTTLRGGTLTESDLYVSSENGLETLSFATIQRMNQSASSLRFEGSMFVSTPQGTERSRMTLSTNQSQTVFGLEGRFGIGKTDIECSDGKALTMKPTQELTSKEIQMLDVLCRSIYPLSTLSDEFEWNVSLGENADSWTAVTQTDIDGERFNWTMERFHQSEGFIYPQKVTLQHVDESLRVFMLLKLTHLDLE